MIEIFGKYYIPTCDGCGAELDECDSWGIAVDSMEANGWHYDRRLEENLCPNCKEE